MTDLMWDDIGHDADTEQRNRMLTTASVACASDLAFVIQASTPAEFEDRLSLVAQRIEAVVQVATEGEPGMFPVIHQALLDSFHGYHQNAMASRRQAATKPGRPGGPAEYDQADKNSMIICPHSDCDFHGNHAEVGRHLSEKHGSRKIALKEGTTTEQLIEISRKVLTEGYYAEGNDGVDQFSASLFVQVWDALKPETQEKIKGVPAYRFIDKAWAVSKGASKTGASKAYNEGFNAGITGDGIGYNPYPIFDDTADEWIRGYRDAQGLTPGEKADKKASRKTGLQYEPRTISEHWTCRVCGGRFGPQMVRMVFDDDGVVIGKQCLHHPEGAGSAYAKRKMASEQSDAVDAYSRGERELAVGDRVGDATVTEVGTHTVQFQYDNGYSGAIQVMFSYDEKDEGGSWQQVMTPAWDKALDEQGLTRGDVSIASKVAYSDTCPYCHQVGCSPNCPGPNGGSTICPECGSAASIHDGKVKCSDPQGCGYGWDVEPSPEARAEAYGIDEPSSFGNFQGARTAGKALGQHDASWGEENRYALGAEGSLDDDQFEFLAGYHEGYRDVIERGVLDPKLVAHGALIAEAEFPPKKNDEEDDDEEDDEKEDAPPPPEGAAPPAAVPPAVPDQGGVDPASMTVGEKARMTFTMAEGTSGDVEVTFVREDKGVYFFDGPTGQFGIANTTGEWKDAEGNTFSFDSTDGSADEDDPMKAKADPGAQDEAAQDAAEDDPNAAPDDKDKPPWAKKSSRSRRPFGKAATSMAEFRRMVDEAGTRVYKMDRPQMRDWWGKVMRSADDAVIDYLWDNYADAVNSSGEGDSSDSAIAEAVAMHLGETSDVPFPTDTIEQNRQHNLYLDRYDLGPGQTNELGGPLPKDTPVEFRYCNNCNFVARMHKGGPDEEGPRRGTVCSIPYSSLTKDNTYSLYDAESAIKGLSSRG